MYTKESFCNLVIGKSYDEIAKIVTDKPYKEFYIPKNSGYRKINWLDEKCDLAVLQKRLLNNFLIKQPLPVCVKGFRKRENYNNFLSPHIGARYFLRIDIKDFFQSLEKSIVQEELAKIINSDSEEDKIKLLELISEIVTYNGSLPQGAYTSPTTSNIVMVRIDQRILKYCQVFGIKYTRYADDLLFSSDDFPFEKRKWFLKKVKYILSTNKLQLNYSKIKYAEDEICLNGYIISDNGIRLSRNRLHDIRKVVVYVRQNYMKVKGESKKEFLNGINSLKLKHRNLNTNEFRTIFQVKQYMCGYRAFIISMLDEEYQDTAFQKSLRRLIRKLEIQIKHLSL